MATLLTMVWLPVGPWTVAAATVGGALLYSSQPLLIVRAQEAIPEAPTAAAGIVIGLGGGIAGAVYVGIGVVQETVGHTVALIGGVALLLPAVAAAHLALRKSGDTRA
jgi:FSR family fosmidomycin resistance protein-like MFS transporter